MIKNNRQKKGISIGMRMMGLFLMMGFLILGVKPVQAEPVNYQVWENILQTYVNDNGLVNYDGLKKNRNVLDKFIKNEVENTDISHFSKIEQKTFWINAYNALTMRLIVDNYPLRFGGIRTINWGKPWDLKMKAAGRSLSLGQIEHEILRKWNPIDPRIHFAINCASIGCPKLPKTPFTSDQLDEQLNREAIRFINDKEKVRLDRSKNILYHSAIFNWFEEDFFAVSANKVDFILKYLNSDDKAYILKNRNKIQLKELKYDWGLNKQ